MKNDAEKISETMRQPVQSIERISGGKSGARCYAVISSKARWIAKLFSEKPRMEEWYGLLRSVHQPQLVCAEYVRLVENQEVCTLSKWIEGECLEDRLLAHPEEAFDYGVKAAKLLKVLHEKPLSEADLGIQYHRLLKDRIVTVINQIERSAILLPHFDIFKDFLLDAVEKKKVGPISLLHNDVRPNNFIIHEGQLFLIDFENGGIGEYVQEFTTILTITPPVFYPFSTGFFIEYMRDGLPDDFFQKNLLYSVLYILRDVAASKNDSASSLIQAEEQCETLYNLYDGMNASAPVWLRKRIHNCL